MQQVASAYTGGNTNLKISKSPSKKSLLEVTDDITKLQEDNGKLKRNIGDLANERIQLKTKITRLENELLKRDRQLEEILKSKVCEG